MASRRMATRLLVHPHVFVAVAVVRAVAHDRDVLHVGLPAGAGAVVVERRPRHVLDQPPLDLPDQLLALLLIDRRRLQ